MLAVGVLIIASIDVIVMMILQSLRPISKALAELLDIDKQLRSISETENFVQWARLTRKRQELVKEKGQQDSATQKSFSQITTTISRLLKVLLFLFFRSSPVVTIDDEMVPMWLAKACSFTGFGFIRYGDVSCFMWFFCCKAALKCFNSYLPKAATSSIPDILTHLSNPKLD